MLTALGLALGWAIGFYSGVVHTRAAIKSGKITG